jgi:hypothetical protein
VVDGVAQLAALDATALTQAAAGSLEELQATAPDALRIIDKMSGKARHLGFLALLLPRARFIHVSAIRVTSASRSFNSPSSVTTHMRTISVIWALPSPNTADARSLIKIRW